MQEVVPGVSLVKVRVDLAETSQASAVPGATVVRAGVEVLVGAELAASR